MALELNYWRRCPKCGSKNNLVTDRLGGQVLCGGCGLVLQERLEEIVPWGLVRGGEAQNTTSITKPDMGLATVMGRESLDGSGRKIPGNVRGTIDRLRVWDRRTQARLRSGSNLKTAMDELTKLAEKIAISEAVTEKAAYIYRKSIPLISMRGRSVRTLAAAALYAACRSTQTPRTLKDIEDVANLDRLDIARYYRLLVTEEEILQPVDGPARCVSRIACGAGLSAKVERRGLEILDQMDQEGAVTGNSPMGLAAASLYIASVLEGEPSTKALLAKVSGVTKVTIRNRCKAMVSILGLNPDAFDETNRIQSPPYATTTN